MILHHTHVFDRLNAYLEGLLAPEDAADVRMHCDACPSCRGELERLSAELWGNSLQTEGALFGPRRRQPRMHTGARSLFSYFWLALGAVAVVLVGLGVYFETLRPSPHDLRVLGQTEWLPGSSAALHVRVLRHDSQPEVGVPVRVELADSATPAGRRLELASLTTADHGAGVAHFRVPDWPDGTYRLSVTADPRGARSPETLSRTVTIKHSWKLMASTDKPVYQPGQVVHMRGLALRRPDLKPVAGETLTFSLTDPRGNVVFREAKPTSRFGISAADCPLADELLEGTYHVDCRVGETTARATVEFKRYVLPRFKVALELDQPYYQPGQTVKGRVEADYVFGKPVAGGSVTLVLESTDIAPALLQTLDLRTDAGGVAKFEVALPPSLVGREQDGGQARLTFTASVRDPAGELQNKSENRVVAASPIRIEVIPEAGSLVKGLPNTIHVLTTSIDGRPVRTRIAISGLNHELHTNDLGVTSFEFNPTADGQNWTVSAKDERGQTGRRQVEFRCGEIDAGYLVRTDKAVYDGSESIHVLAFGAGVEPIFIDLIKDGQTILSESIEMAQGRGERPIDLPPELFGTVVLHAYRYGPAGLPVRQSRIIYIRPANALAIKVTTDRSEYRPGERASLTFAVTDANGSPAPGAISLAAVDEAVFGVLDRRPGLEQTFFTLERELLKPIYEIKDWSPDLAEADELVRGTQPADRTRLEQALFARAAHGPALHEIAGPLGDDPDVAPALRVLDRPDWQQLAERANLPTELITQLHKAAGPHSLVFSSYSEKLRSVEAFRHAASSNLAKAWFILGLAAFAGLLAWAIANVRRSTIIEVFTIVAIVGVLTGLLLPATQSAREAARRSQAISNLKQIGLAAASHGETGGPKAVRVRRNFPETLLWRPELITDDQGRARLDLELADSITTWRCAVGAVTADGRLGAARTAIRVFQPFFVDIELPTALTRGDEIGIPVVVSNYLDKPQTVTVALAKAPWFDRLETAAERTITLAANEVRSVHFRIRANLVGHQEIEVTARAAEGGVADAVRRAIEVVPDGLRIERVASGTLTRPAEFDLAVPDDAIPGSTRAIAKIYPSSFSQLVEGLDGIFQRPYGCFEQTSSTTYPNVLALDYLRRTGKSVPQVEAKARQYIHLGYQRLLGFEVTGGGFDWFGHPPANRTLTAYGLMEFQDMARVHDVDPSIISRTRTWLLEQQRGDGSWDSEGHSFHGSPADRMSGQALARLATTAYIAWSAFSGQAASTNSEAAQAYLRTNAGVAKNDPYVLALVANALIAIDPEGVAAREHLDRLESLRQMSSDGKLVWWGPMGSPMESAHTLFFAAGECRQIETTALAAQALLSARRSPDVVRSSLAWLVAQKDAHGTWGSTQATILALKALVAGTGKPLGGDTPRRFAVILDGETVHDLTIPAVQSDVVQQFDLSSRIAAAPGTHRLTIEDRSGTDASYQIVFRYHEPDPAGRALAGAASNAGPLAIHIDYDRTTIAVDDVVSAVASVVNNRPDPAPMVILDLPIPAGFAIASDDLAGLVKAGSIAKFQLSARSAIVYLRDLEPDKPLTLRYRLRATMPVKLMVPAARAYEYYNPEREGTSQPVRLTVTAKS